VPIDVLLARGSSRKWRLKSMWTTTTSIMTPRTKGNDILRKISLTILSFFFFRSSADVSFLAFLVETILLPKE
jgi:hypothetical protein